MKFRNYDKYEVYPDGRIYSYKSKKFLKPGTEKNGYKRVCLVDNEGKGKWYMVHRIVLEAVTRSPIPQGYEINHIDEMKDNNAINNLELVSHKQNINFGTGNERRAKSLSKQVGAFKKDGKLVMTFASTNEAGRNGFNQCAVVRCCNNCFNREGNNVYKGFTWKYI